MRSVIYTSLLLALIAGASLGYDQKSSLPNGNACQFLSKADAESILGTAVKRSTQNPSPGVCQYLSVGFTNKPPNDKQVHLTIYRSNQPDPDSYQASKKGASSWPNFHPGDVITDIPNFADAAYWFWGGTGGELNAFEGGTMSVEVTVAGIPEASALQGAKAVAAKVFGATSGTGYAYLGTPKSNASVATAKAKSSAHAVGASRARAHTTPVGNRQARRGTEQSARAQGSPAAQPVRSNTSHSSLENELAETPKDLDKPDALDKAESEAEIDLRKDPKLYWRVSQEPATNSDIASAQVTAGRFIFNDGGLLDVTAACFRNGIRMLFLVTNLEGDAPEFDMYTDPSASDPNDDQTMDVRIRVDSGNVHVAKGYPEEKDGELFNNYMGLIFYDRGFHQRVYDSNIHNDTTFDVALDGAIAPLVRKKAQVNADDAVATAGGPISELLSARSIRVELPVKDHAHPVIDLNPQDKVFHHYVADCNARFK